MFGLGTTDKPSDTVYSVHEETWIHVCFVPVHGCVYNKPHLNFMQRSRKAVELQMLGSSGVDFFKVCMISGEFCGFSLCSQR